MLQAEDAAYQTFYGIPMLAVVFCRYYVNEIVNRRQHCQWDVIDAALCTWREPWQFPTSSLPLPVSLSLQTHTHTHVDVKVIRSSEGRIPKYNLQDRHFPVQNTKHFWSAQFLWRLLTVGSYNTSFKKRLQYDLLHITVPAYRYAVSSKEA